MFTIKCWPRSRDAGVDDAKLDFRPCILTMRAYRTSGKRLSNRNKASRRTILFFTVLLRRSMRAWQAVRGILGWGMMRRDLPLVLSQSYEFNRLVHPHTHIHQFTADCALPTGPCALLGELMSSALVEKQTTTVIARHAVRI